MLDLPARLDLHVLFSGHSADRWNLSNRGGRGSLLVQEKVLIKRMCKILLVSVHRRTHTNLYLWTVLFGLTLMQGHLHLKASIPVISEHCLELSPVAYAQLCENVPKCYPSYWWWANMPHATWWWCCWSSWIIWLKRFFHFREQVHSDSWA